MLPGTSVHHAKPDDTTHRTGTGNVGTAIDLLVGVNRLPRQRKQRRTCRIASNFEHGTASGVDTKHGFAINHGGHDDESAMGMRW